MPLRLVLAGLLLLTALGLGLVGYQVTRPPVTIRIAAEAPPPPATSDVLVAARGLLAGALLKDEDITQLAVPTADVPKGALANTPEVRATVKGAMLRRYLDSGGILVANDILHARDRGFLAAELAPATRAISVGVDAITGNGGLIWPGDRVDVILAQDLSDRDAAPARRAVAETVLSDVRVVAVDQTITEGGVATGDNAIGRLARTVTLEVTPAQAESAVVAQHLGKITLSIRAVDVSGDATSHPAAVYGGDVSAALADSPPHMRVIEGSADREVTFQRAPDSTLPITPAQGAANARPQPL